MKTFCSAFHGVKIGIYKTLHTTSFLSLLTSFLWLKPSSLLMNVLSVSLFLSSSLNSSQLYETWQHPSITFSQRVSNLSSSDEGCAVPPLPHSVSEVFQCPGEDSGLLHRSSGNQVGICVYRHNRSFCKPEVGTFTITITCTSFIINHASFMNIFTRCSQKHNCGVLSESKLECDHKA